MTRLTEYLSRDQVTALREYLEGRRAWKDLTVEAQQALVVAHKLVEDATEDGGRDAPFTKRRTTAEVADQIGDVDEAEMLESYRELRSGEIVNALMQRLPAKPDDDQPISLREIVEGAIDIREKRKGR